MYRQPDQNALMNFHWDRLIESFSSSDAAEYLWDDRDGEVVKD